MREDALAAELLARAELEILHFLGKGSFRHANSACFAISHAVGTNPAPDISYIKQRYSR